MRIWRGSPYPLGATWDGTAIESGEGAFENLFTGQTVAAAGGVLAVADVFADLPVALLIGPHRGMSET